MPVAYFLPDRSRDLTGRAMTRWSLDRRAQSFTVAVGLHLLLGAAILFIAAPPLLEEVKKEPTVELIELPEPRKPLPPKPVVQPVAKPAPVVRKVAPVEPAPRPPTPRPVINTPAPVIPAPQMPVQEDAPEPEIVHTPAEAAPPLPIQQPVEDVYIPPDSDAAYLHNPQPPYPLIAQRRGWQGVVLLEVKVSAEGKPLAVQVKKSSGYPVLDDTALATVRDSFRFVPASRNGQKVEATVELPMNFKLK